MAFAHTLINLCIEEFLALAKQLIPPSGDPNKGILYVDSFGQLQYIGPGDIPTQVTQNACVKRTIEADQVIGADVTCFQRHPIIADGVNVVIEGTGELYPL